MRKIRVLFVASEGVPFAKTGGLADVVGALPSALEILGLEVKVLMPYYSQVRESNISTYTVADGLRVSLDGYRLGYSVRSSAQLKYPFYFIERNDFFHRSQLYGNGDCDFADNLERFALFCKTVPSFCEVLDFWPDIIHCHDWQSALVPVYLRHLWAKECSLAGTKTVLTIHNLAYQGRFPGDKFRLLGLPSSLFGINGLEYHNQVNFLKGGIISADAITTVSPSYCQEILSEELGEGLDGVLRTRGEHLSGILNGVDYQAWSPETDSLIPEKFSAGDLAGKVQNKYALLEAFGLSKDLADAPVLAMISRLADQKGFDLLAGILPELMKQKLTLVILGTGDKRYHHLLPAEAAKYPGKLGVKIAFDNKLAHLIEAGADMFLMPSRFEPCGLNQIYSLRYGTIPIVRATGGLADTVIQFDPAAGTGTGYVFDDYSPDAFLDAVFRALVAYADKDLWRGIMRNAMSQDFSWGSSAKEYLKLYERLISGQ